MNKKWYKCPLCGCKLAKYDPLEAICSGVYIKCRQCKEIIEIKKRKPQHYVEKFRKCP